MIHPVSIERISEMIQPLSQQLAIPKLEIRSVSIDTRRITEPASTIFIALRSTRRDGHEFLEQALAAGVQSFIVEDAERLKGHQVNYLVVDQSLAALHQWAKAHRDQFSYPILAITGSNGKTIVKEWLAQILSKQMDIYRSPGSYNSQIGVPLSLLGLAPGKDLGIIEAGISKPGEMARLEQIIHPNLGVLTHFGDAHDEGFENSTQKLEEKLRLFSGVRRIWSGGMNEWVIDQLKDLKCQISCIGHSNQCEWAIEKVELLSDQTSFSIRKGAGTPFEFNVPFTDPASQENALLVAMVALDLELDPSKVREGLRNLAPVSMRLELLSENPEITIINDTYNTDLASTMTALSVLESDKTQKHKIAIISDFEIQGANSTAIHQRVCDLAVEKFGADQVILIGERFEPVNKAGATHFRSTRELISQFQYDGFKGATVLLKGSRKHGLEQLIPYLTRKVNATRFEINLDHLKHNLDYFRSLIPLGTKVMAMVKASSYGSGSWEVAAALEQDGVDALAVASLTEAIALRTKGISLPIMVLNPDPGALGQLFHFNLEPEIFNFQLLRAYHQAGLRSGIESMPLHLKVDTGMHRVGFSEGQIPELVNWLNEHPEIKVKTLMSHLAAADDPQMDDFSNSQIQLFEQISQAIFEGIGNPVERHILNSAGILRFPGSCFDMVRVGIGLYGVSPLEEPLSGLKEVGSLISEISQIRTYGEGESVGYGRSQFTTGETTIATIPVGYADGIRRSLGNGRFSFLVNGQLAPTFGRICMDLLMLDITGIPGVEVGDEVVLLGSQGNRRISVIEMARALGTIPYEVLTGIGQRVRRVYVRD